MPKGKPEKIFDEWRDRYNAWFTTPMGALIKHYETELVMAMLRPAPGERILDAGCGTGIFTQDIFVPGTRVVGLELSFPMLQGAVGRFQGRPFQGIQGDINRLPFSNNAFDRTVSVTALEFIEDAEGAVRELFRVTHPGGSVVMATLNSLSPWAARRKTAGKKGHPLFKQAIFRSPREIRALTPVKGTLKTAIFFKKEDPLDLAGVNEEKGQSAGLDTGAFIVVRWRKPNR
ncbi:MAG: methyltransferase domain-containing protein [Deltaproteobacteria bacterium]|nr:methyltransferase domain-containing protein [Deltaproteobacteria bacterium]MBW2206476.1 methyltransferase domain-containing protein [Deltaproteobacteria bacterium]